LLALALALGAVVSIMRPQLETRLPLGSCALGVGFFGLLSVWQIRDRALFAGGDPRVAVDVAYGSYLGLAAAAIVCVAGLARRRRELARGDLTITLAAAALSSGVLAAFLIPEITAATPRIGQGVSFFYEIGINDELPILIVGLLCFGLPLWTSPTRGRARLAVSAAIAVLVGGFVSPFLSQFLGGYVSQFGSTPYWPWELSLLCGCSAGLVVLALATSHPLHFGRPGAADVTAFVAGSLLLVSLFLEWQKADSVSGWQLTHGAIAGGLALTALILRLGFGRLPVELIVGAAIYVMAAGFSISQFPRFVHGFRFAPGTLLGFAAATLLLLAAARRLREIPRSPRRRSRLVPGLACLAFLAFPIAVLVRDLPRFGVESPWALGWLMLPAILVALRLLGRWLSGPRADEELLLLPFLLLALTSLDVIYIRMQGIGWESWCSLGLCLLLTLLGWIETRGGGLESVAEMFRVDRVSAAEN